MRGKPANQKHTYVASLQLNGQHICSSGLFQEGFLLTTGACALYLIHGMTLNNETGTAVLGNSNLKKGQRVLILEISQASTMGIDDDFGVVMVSLFDSFDNLWLSIW